MSSTIRLFSSERSFVALIGSELVLSNGTNFTIKTANKNVLFSTYHVQTNVY